MGLWVAPVSPRPDYPVRAICATTDRDALPDISTWCLTTNLSAQQAPLAHVVRLYGLRNWIEQGYKQMKNELGWADFMVRSDRAIRRHLTLVLCAWTFCWWHETYRAAVSANASRQAATPVPKKTGTGKHLVTSCWPRALRAVRAWLVPAYWLTRCWNAFSDTPPPARLAKLLKTLASGQGINLYLRT